MTTRRDHTVPETPDPAEVAVLGRRHGISPEMAGPPGEKSLALAHRFVQACNAARREATVNPNAFIDNEAVLRSIRSGQPDFSTARIGDVRPGFNRPLLESYCAALERQWNLINTGEG